jgi:L-aspartate oxidase
MQTDVLVIGCGVAGATAALELSADRERSVTVLTRSIDPAESASGHAQGGIVGLGQGDSAELLARDVMATGDGLCLPEAVRVLAEEGPGLVRSMLIERCGVAFDRSGGTLDLGLEGAHSRRRVYHVGDRTGRAIMDGLLRALAERPNVELLSAHTAIDLLTFPHHALDPIARYGPVACHGVYTLDQRTRTVERITSRHTILASGGLGQLFLNTTNPVGARGDGLAMAHRAGARVLNAEYVQFHPTALSMPGTTKALITEALRGEGAILLDPDGRPFMDRYDPRRELAPRDVVARAIYTEMLARDATHVYLDIASRQPADFIRERFPEVCARCREHGIDPTSEPIPVVPAAHYACGGVLADLRGRTSIPHLYAIGEVACTGVHGANRLASTSLLEGLVWGVRAAADVRGCSAGRPIAEEQVPPWDESRLTDDADPALVSVDVRSIRNLMWHYVGLRRNEDRLRRASRELRRLWLDIEDFYSRARLTDGVLGLRNMARCAVVVAQAALRNRTSRGCHWREDALPDGPGRAGSDVDPGDESIAP